MEGNIKKKNPKVSIIIPVYNGSNYLHDALESALAQTYKNIEVIVINDGSTDNGKAEEIARSYGDKIHYFYKENGGVASALNLGIRKMTGEYFSWLSHDDLYYPTKVWTQIEYLKSCERKDIILCSNWEIIDHKSARIGMRRIIHSKERKGIYLVMNGYTYGCTLLVPKMCFDDVGLFNEEYATTQDYDLWFKMARRYEFVHIPEVLVKYRVHSEQDTIKHPDHLKEEDRLHTNFNRELTKEEILELEESLSVFYIKRAIFYKKRFPEAEEYTYNLFRRNLFKERALHIPLCILLLLRYKLLPNPRYFKYMQDMLILLASPLRWREFISIIHNRRIIRQKEYGEKR